MASTRVLFSGIQPTGVLTIGNYIGAVQQWLALQDQYDCLFSLVDQHAITVRQDPQNLRAQCFDMLALLLACGLDPDKNIIYLQSQVAEHSQLTWLLNCFTYYGELTRMTQFKDKASRYADNINVGLFDYPVLMASDILLYQTSLVPVGEDQKQHLELTRELAERFNYYYGDIFSVPEPWIPKAGARVMSLQDPQAKMSKSDANQNGYISLRDEPELVRKKIMKSVTDSGSEIVYRDDKPGISNLLTLYAAVSGREIADLETSYADYGYGAFKKDLAQAVMAFLEPIQDRFAKWRRDEDELRALLHKSAQKATDKARPTLRRAMSAVGFITE